jgi:hypothetical protein
MPLPLLNLLRDLVVASGLGIVLAGVVSAIVADWWERR